MVKGRSELQMQLTATPPPVKKSISAKPAGLAEMQIKIIIPLSMRRATRSAFKIISPARAFQIVPFPLAFLGKEV